MAGLVPTIHVFSQAMFKTWMLAHKGEHDGAGFLAQPG
jgi:hypothetical protein